MANKSKQIGDVLVVQPILEPWPSVMRKVGRFAVFLYTRWSSWALGFEILPKGAAIYIGPFMIGACHLSAKFEEPTP